MGKLNCLFIADFVVSPLELYLKSEMPEWQFTFHCAPFGQARQSLQNFTLPLWQNELDLCVIWTFPHKVSPAFSQLLARDVMDWQGISSEVRELARCIEAAASRSKIIIIPAWTLPSYCRGRGILDYRNSIGVVNTLMRMNLLLADELESISNIFILDTGRWMAAVPRVEDQKLWYLGKIPFSRDFFILAAREMTAVVRAVYGGARKILVLDLDNTLWGGEIGDLGLAGIGLGGIDPVGEAFVDFQKQILALKNRGVLLAIASKNEEASALEVFDLHPEMVLRRDDFVGWRINWRDKAQNIMEMIGELNLGLQAVVFVDDNPAERARVAEALPEVMVPDWPADPLSYGPALSQLTCFDSISSNQEDRERTQYYLAEKQRKNQRAGVQSLEEWLHTLNIRVSYAELNHANLPRAVQLLNKTNQFNLITRRMEQDEFFKIASLQGYRVLTFRVWDRFGDYGLVGVSTFRLTETAVELEDFILSCRSMGRGVERAMLYTIKEYTLRYQKNQLVGHYIPTAKNKPCENFFAENEFKFRDGAWVHSNLEAITLPLYLACTPDEKS